MKIAVIGSRGLTVDNLGDYLPPGTTEIVSGGARGIDTCAERYAAEHGLKCTVFLPEYHRYGRSAPIRRNEQIIAYADRVIAFWDRQSPGTRFVIQRCREIGKPVTILVRRA